MLLKSQIQTSGSSFPETFSHTTSNVGWVNTQLVGWNGSAVSKHTENMLVLVISNSLVMIGFDEMAPQNMKNMTMKKDQKKNHHVPKKLCKPLYLRRSVQCTHRAVNPLISITHMKGLSNDCLKT
ncbi:hypothetical protein AVEN_72629-1 [Araneus ventricosus]|uniref:Uncharacterized protein n=1 Tax=Araneus ventricosus TaxID=182803 RepID=A0A4Y2A651_ARAVE|nr:hypothetical protein AVEN_72629-1 [Araneus ventricosus]